MAKRNLVLLFILGFLAKSSLAAESITTKNWPKFAGVEWGSSVEVVKQALEEKGYECRKPFTNSKGVHRFGFTGILAGKEAEGVCAFASKKLNMITITYSQKFTNEEFSVKLLGILRRKYGDPKSIQSTDRTVNCLWALAEDVSRVAILYQWSNTGLYVTYLSPEESEEMNNRAKKQREQEKKSEEDF